jgi:hypothetical protein
MLIAAHRGGGKTSLVRRVVAELRSSYEPYGIRPGSGTPGVVRISDARADTSPPDLSSSSSIRLPARRSDFPGIPLLVEVPGPNLLRATTPEPAEGGTAQSALQTRSTTPGDTGIRAAEVPPAATDPPVGPDSPGDGIPTAQRAPAGSSAPTGPANDGPRQTRAAVNPLEASAATALSEITLRLYRAVSVELVQAYALSLDDRHKELAAELEMALDSAPDTALLRDFWERAGALPEGVLFPPMTRVDADGVRDCRTRGLEELTALATAAQAFRFMSGEVSTTENKGADADREARLAATLTRRGGLFPTILGLAAGSAVGAGLLFNHFGAGVGTAAATVLASMLLEYRTSVSVRQSRKLDYRFVWKRDAATLTRELPLLIERLWDAGIRPVFLIDELDKVSAVDEQIDAVVHSLKTIFSEKAFFCFLTDRDYFERLQYRSLVEPYPREHTYFSQRLYVAYLPEELHDYLREVLVPQGNHKTDQDEAEVLRYVLLQRSRMHMVDLHREIAALRNERSEVSLAPGVVSSLPAFKYAVLAQVGVEYVLAQEIVRDRLRDNPGLLQKLYDTLYFPSRAWRRGDNTFDASPEALRAELERRMEPNEIAAPTRRMALAGEASDAPAEIPTSNCVGVSGSDLAFLHARLLDYLGHMATPAILKGLLGARGATTATVPGVSAPPKPVDFPSIVIEACPDVPLVEMVAGSFIYSFTFDIAGAPIDVPGLTARERKKTARTSSQPRPEAAPSGTSGGTAVASPPLGAASASNAAASQIERGSRAVSRNRVHQLIGFVDAVETHIVDLLGSGDALRVLAQEVGILARSPAWEHVDGVRRRLAELLPGLDRRTSAAGGSAVGRDSPLGGFRVSLEDIQVLQDYADMLRQRSPLMWLAIACAADAGRYCNMRSVPMRRMTALKVIGNRLEFAEETRALAMTNALTARFPTVRGRTPERLGRIHASAIEKWIEPLKRAVADIEQQPVMVAQVQAAAWAAWDTRLEQDFRGATRTRHDANYEDIACECANVWPAGLLPLDQTAMGWRDWTTAACAALTGATQRADLDASMRALGKSPAHGKNARKDGSGIAGSNGDDSGARPPRWLLYPALYHLGMGALTEHEGLSSARTATAATPETPDPQEAWQSLLAAKRPIRIPEELVVVVDAPLDWNIPPRYAGLHIDSTLLSPSGVEGLLGKVLPLTSWTRLILATRTIDSPYRERLSDPASLEKRIGSSVPVVFVHGFNGEGDPGFPSLDKALENLKS